MSYFKLELPFEASLTTLGVLSGLVCISVWKLFGTGAYKGKTPPSPPKSWIPLVGNAFQVMAPEPLLPIKLCAWAKEIAGPEGIYCFDVFGTRIFVLTTAQAQKDLFDLRGNIYSSRADLPLLRDFVCRRANIAFLE